MPYSSFIEFTVLEIIEIHTCTYRDKHTFLDTETRRIIISIRTLIAGKNVAEERQGLEHFL